MTRKKSGTAGKRPSGGKRDMGILSCPKLSKKNLIKFANIEEHEYLMMCSTTGSRKYHQAKKNPAGWALDWGVILANNKKLEQI